MTSEDIKHQLIIKLEEWMRAKFTHHSTDPNCAGHTGCEGAAMLWCSNGNNNKKWKKCGGFDVVIGRFEIMV